MASWDGCLDLVSADQLLEIVGAFADTTLAHALAIHVLLDPVEVVGDFGVDAGQGFSDCENAISESRSNGWDFSTHLAQPRPQLTMPMTSIEPVGPSATIGPPESP
jgi:hypothetical protein